MSIFVIDDHPLMREAVVMLLRRLRASTQVVELERLASVSKAIAEHGEPELVCLDLKLPDTNGVSGVREVRQMLPDTSLIVLSASPSSDYEDLAREAGADAYVEKSAGAAQIAKVLREFLAEEAGDDENAPTIPDKLSKRQKQLLVMLDRGLSNRDIAEQLSISEHTVKVHLWRLFRRLNVKSRSQASHLARTAGLLDL
ncbi:response regulator transcription factor [Hydrogenophaga sp. IBVHS2]|jgi:DNA-binding NarL/FixJ family response regulator|uniref:LuxR C-terminal-related transcriptional regulator n=1 Tax=Hydrogenophaga sp. IBVHS2 TaxID=1985170 RepID=UPI000A2DD02B|nr:response regulator transcription factor [Hydrogenophaga sp. IBVHS2]OSZ65429.1 DNA-binding response regulator [Hydrogenophaga sp. IBVHS2]